MSSSPALERAAPRGTKRKSTDGADANKENESAIDLSSIDVEGLPMADNPDQIRRKINRLIENGGMKVGEFCNTIGVSNVSYNRFMQQHGPTKGAMSDVYMNAAGYFMQREIAGLKLPTAASKKAKTDSGAKASASAGAESGSASTKTKEKPDWRTISLEGEHVDDVPVYDTAGDVRRKISAYLREPGVTQAQFCRDLSNLCHDGTQLRANQLARFRGKSGANEGGDSMVFYAAYVLFEKKRVAEGKPKSKKRKEMEEVWPDGVDRQTFGRMR